MKKKLLAVLMVMVMAFALTACGGGESKTDDAAATDQSSDANADAGTDDASADADTASSSGETIKVGIINNDPNESGYRTANDKDLKAKFSAENGYDAQFAYSLKNDEQQASAKKFIEDGVDYLLLSAADTSGWDSVLRHRMQERELSFSTVPSMQILHSMRLPSYLIWTKRDRQQLTGLQDRT